MGGWGICVMQIKLRCVVDVWPQLQQHLTRLAGWPDQRSEYCMSSNDQKQGSKEITLIFWDQKLGQTFPDNVKTLTHTYTPTTQMITFREVNTCSHNTQARVRQRSNSYGVCRECRREKNNKTSSSSSPVTHGNMQLLLLVQRLHVQHPHLTGGLQWSALKRNPLSSRSGLDCSKWSLMVWEALPLGRADGGWGCVIFYRCTNQFCGAVSGVSRHAEQTCVIVEIFRWNKVVRVHVIPWVFWKELKAFLTFLMFTWRRATSDLLFFF